MMGVRMEAAHRGHGLRVTTLVALGLFLLAALSVSAKEAKRRQISVAINKGETYVISGFSKKMAPKIRVVSNPNAVVVNTNEPGKLVLVGADAGTCDFDLTLASGEKVTYVVTVTAVAPPQGSLEPGSAPTPIRP